jgi:hypothetical protein
VRIGKRPSDLAVSNLLQISATRSSSPVRSSANLGDREVVGAQSGYRPRSEARRRRRVWVVTAFVKVRVMCYLESLLASSSVPSRTSGVRAWAVIPSRPFMSPAARSAFRMASSVASAAAWNSGVM